MVFRNITLGGRLYSIQLIKSNDSKKISSEEIHSKKSANASLGIPEKVEIKGGGSSAKGNPKEEGEKKSEFVDNIMWSGLGGNPGLAVE